MSQQAISRTIPWPVPATGILLAVIEIPWVLLSLFVAGMTCDEGCDPTSGLWRDNPDAWQWHAFLDLSVIGLVCTIAAVAFAFRDRVQAAAVAAGLATISVIAWASIYASGA
jgi:hypothetical protein